LSLEYAILGFLNYRPYTGYELKKVFDRTVSYFWPADQSQIYRTLARLEEAGFVEVEKVVQDDLPMKKIHHITDKGRRDLDAWLSGPAPMDQGRSAALIQVFFAGRLSDEQVLEKFEEHAAKLREILRQFEGIPEGIKELSREAMSERESFFWMLTLESGLYSMRSSLEWAESVIERIKKGLVPGN